MKHLTDSTLSVIDRATAKLGPLNALLDKLVERVIPTTTAAACSGVFCGLWCDTADECAGYLKFYGHYRYATSTYNCNHGIYSCKALFCGC